MLQHNLRSAFRICNSLIISLHLAPFSSEVNVFYSYRFDGLERHKECENYSVSQGSFECAFNFTFPQAANRYPPISILIRGDSENVMPVCATENPTTLGELNAMQRGWEKMVEEKRFVGMSMCLRNSMIRSSLPLIFHLEIMQIRFGSRKEFSFISILSLSLF